ncbi:OmpH family outer membrane protein [Sphingorhabdus sp.]|jgi:Skp family chaperone for outer membrane proteins|uniref:OmpH family outer membrane protein n=1 Tax=Sphingorhabdus sp. TaxID=1902408 RepID=UPI0037C749D8
MNFKSKKVALLLALSSAATPFAANAQVAGIGVTEPVAVITSAKALQQGYKQIETTFASNLDLIDARTAESQQLQQQLATQFDANKDNQLSPEEQQKMQASNSPLIAQINAKQEEIAKLVQPIRAAQIFVVDSVDKSYLQALKDVVAANKINVVLAPDAVLWAPDAINITPKVTQRLDVLVPAVSITPPEEYSVSRRVMTLYESVTQVLQARAMRAMQQAQAQQAAQQQAGAAPAGTAAPAPAPQAPQPESR